MGQRVENGKEFRNPFREMGNFFKGFPEAEKALSLRREFLREASKQGLSTCVDPWIIVQVEKLSPFLAKGRRNLTFPGMVYQRSELVARVMTVTGPTVVAGVSVVEGGVRLVQAARNIVSESMEFADLALTQGN